MERVLMLMLMLLLLLMLLLRIIIRRMMLRTMVMMATMIPFNAWFLSGFRGVSFAYPTRKDARIFEDFNLTVEASQTVALVGASGSGKSTSESLASDTCHAAPFP
jgi:ABC-type polysaccharide/polyol phosphate transport system ATPase subunit